MEKIMTIKQVNPVSERNYTDRNGQQQVFVSRGLILADGIDTAYAELVGDAARRTDLAPGQTVCVSMSIHVREYEDRNHEKRYANEITVNRIGQ